MYKNNSRRKLLWGHFFAFSRHLPRAFSNITSHRIFKKASELHQFNSDFFFFSKKYVGDTKLGIPAFTSYFLNERKYSNGVCRETAVSRCHLGTVFPAREWPLERFSVSFPRLGGCALVPASSSAGAARVASSPAFPARPR